MEAWPRCPRSASRPRLPALILTPFGRPGYLARAGPRAYVTVKDSPSGELDATIPGAASVHAP